MYFRVSWRLESEVPSISTTVERRRTALLLRRNNTAKMAAKTAGGGNKPLESLLDQKEILRASISDYNFVFLNIKLL